MGAKLMDLSQDYYPVLLLKIPVEWSALFLPVKTIVFRTSHAVIAKKNRYSSKQ